MCVLCVREKPTKKENCAMPVTSSTNQMKTFLVTIDGRYLRLVGETLILATKETATDFANYDTKMLDALIANESEIWGKHINIIME